MQASFTGVRLRVGAPSAWALVTMALLAVLVTLLSSAAAEDATWGDKEVVSPEEYDGLNLTLDGNLTVRAGGSLDIVNSSIVFNTTEVYALNITVEEGGHLNLTNTTISSIGGSYGMRVLGNLHLSQVVVDDLFAELNAPEVGGLKVIGSGRAVLEDVEFPSSSGGLHVSDGGTVEVKGGLMAGSAYSLFVELGALVTLEGTQIIDPETDPAIGVETGGTVTLESCEISYGTPGPTGETYPPVAINEAGASVSLVNCTINTNELAYIGGATFEVLGCTFNPPGPSSQDDLWSDDSTIILEDIALGSILVNGGELWLWNSTYEAGQVGNDTQLHSFGHHPPDHTIDDTVTWHQYYWVDFKLLNADRSPGAGLGLIVETAEKVEIIDTKADAEGWVRHVPLRSWTLKGDAFSYEPSHKVWFGDVDQWITYVQVFGNTTVVLWNSDVGNDLALRPEAITPSDSSPEEDEPFNIRVQGETLLPRTFSGQAQISLWVDGSVVQTKLVDTGSATDIVFEDLTFSEGLHNVSVTVDSDGKVEELNEGGNNEARIIIEVAAGSAPGTEIDLYVVITGLEDSAENHESPWRPGVIWVDYTVHARYATSRVQRVDVQLLVDGAERDSDSVDLGELVGAEYLHRGRLNVNLPEGDYRFEVRVDQHDKIDEEYENNNVDTMSRVQLSTESDDNFFDMWDPVCCSSLGFFLLLLIISLLSSWMQRRKKREGIDDVAYPQSTRQQPGEPGAPYSSTRGGEVEEKWTSQRIDRELGSIYSVDDRTGRLEPKVVKRPPPRARGGRYKLTGVNCPRCASMDIMGFPDRSAKCQSCRKIFYLKRPGS
jgi:hypothetical protein